MNRADFDILNEKVYNKPLVYLDNAATSQKPRVVIDAIVEGYTKWNANIHRGVHHLSQVATRKHEEARQQMADFLHAKSSKEILFTKGTTDSINILAFSFGEAFVGEGDEVVVTQLEHHSNIVPWQMLCERKKAKLRYIPLKEDLTLDLDAAREILNERTKIVSIAHVSNVLGTINPVEEVIRLAHEKGIPVCVDGAQSAPHLPIDLQQLNCDFYVCSGHKMYGPTGIGVLYGKEEWLEKMPPAEGGGEMIEHVSMEKTTYNELPYKFEAGTPNYIGSYALSIATKYMLETGIQKIAEHEQELSAYLEQELKKIEGVKIYGDGKPKVGVVSFNIYNKQGQLIHPFDIGTLLDRQGVAVRTGHHCAEPLMDYLQVPGTVRASMGLYNDKADIDALIKALHVAIEMLS